jgi:hypothetical protein
MADATISRVRMRDLARLGCSGPAAAGGAGLRRACASPRRPLTDATGIGKRPPRRPRRTSSRPAVGDLMASTIYGGRSRVQVTPPSVVEKRRGAQGGTRRAQGTGISSQPS